MQSQPQPDVSDRWIYHARRNFMTLLCWALDWKIYSALKKEGEREDFLKNFAVELAQKRSLKDSLPRKPSLNEATKQLEPSPPHKRATPYASVQPTKSISGLGAIYISMLRGSEDVAMQDLSDNSQEAEADLPAILGSKFPLPIKDDLRPFPEDFAMRGLLADGYYPDTWFSNEKIDDEEKYLDVESMTDDRKERIRWIGYRRKCLEVDKKQASPREPSIWKRAYAKTSDFKRKGIRILIGGKKCLARPDHGADRDVMTEAFANQHGLVIHRGDEHTGLFRMGTSKYVQSIGRTLVPLSVIGSLQSDEHRWFHVLKKCAVPVLLGVEFIKKIKLFTSNKGLLVDYPGSWMPVLKWIGAPKERINFIADGRSISGGADTGSDLDLMSLQYARKRGFKIDRRSTARTRVMLADETIVETIGQVHVSSVKLSQFDTFEMSFHVLPGLPCDVILGEEFLEQMDAFNTCDIVHADEDNMHSLNTLINLGPIQAFLSRNCTSKPNDTVQQEHDSAIEAEIYRRNKANRSLAKIKDESRAAKAIADEEGKRRAFDSGHARCLHCVGGGGGEALGG